MREITIDKKYRVLVDDADYELVSGFRWSVLIGKNGYPYAMRWVSSKPVLMHRFLLSTPKGMVVDHINGNGLDNRRENIRICSHTENMRNRRINRNNTTGFKGVSVSLGRKKKYQASLERFGKKITFGYFEKLEDAARAYDIGARMYFGDFARTNF